MLDRKYMDTLALVYGRLAGSGVNWVLTGSLSFSIRGIPFDVHDIDIQTDKWGAYTIEKTFAAEITKKVTLITGDMIRSHFWSAAGKRSGCGDHGRYTEEATRWIMGRTR